MNKKLEILGNRLIYGELRSCIILPEELSTYKEIVSDFAAMQSELEILRETNKVFDWLGLHIHHIGLSHTVLGGYKAWDTKGKQIAEKKTFMGLVNSLIAKHETDKISDKGDTMETKPPNKTKLEIRQDPECDTLYSLWCNGLKCVGITNRNGQIYKQWEEYIAHITSLESRLAELEELAEAVNVIEKEGLSVRRYSGNEPHDRWVVCNPDHLDNEGLHGHGNTPVAAVADYREKHPEPVIKTNELTHATGLVRELLGLLEEIAPDICRNTDVCNDARRTLAREKGE